ncbi:MAG: DNA gyrase inhibitor YacG [Nitrospira sp.]|nr:DNA gyrase inhibitor YacG [Nitrospira sp.]TKB74175.1 MAG: DNA gyrase inhibitor YacG [Nitrospira sp.]
MTCPLCRQPSIWEGNPWRPFCSERCQMTDLGAWAMEWYRIPGPTLTLDISPSDSSESDDDEATQQTDKL